MTLRQAFRDTGRDNEEAFRALSQRIGKDTMKKWIDSLGYGNKVYKTTVPWIDGSLKITPDEELGLVKKLYFDQLPFFQRTQRIVRDMMKVEDNANYQLYYKTGSGYAGAGPAVGWVVGWIEENKHPYFFVLNLGSVNPFGEIDKTGPDILRGILRKMGFFEGKK
jgi:beta-lactamase class D